MSFEVLTAGELAFPSAQHRERWRASKVSPSVFPDVAAHFELERTTPTSIAGVLSEFKDVHNAHTGLTYYLDLAEADAKLTVRGLVHSEGFQADFVAVFAAAAAFGARGTLQFETTEGEAFTLTCDGSGATFAEANAGDLDAEVSQQILAESERRSGRRATPKAAKPVLAAIAALGKTPDPAAVQAILDAAMQLGATERRAVLTALGSRRIEKSREARKTAKKAKRSEKRAK